MARLFNDMSSIPAARFEPGVTRRALMTGGSAGLLLAASAATAQTAPELSVTEALRLRRSTRAFSDKPVDPALLAKLLWAACGVNRPESGLRTAPSWRGAADTRVHVATGDGVYEYRSEDDALSMRTSGDIRATLSTQPFVATAPVCLVLLSDIRALSAADVDEQKRVYAQIDAAIVAQNVYLFAAAVGLGTCLVGGADRPAITQAMRLQPHEYIAFVQPIGWPA